VDSIIEFWTDMKIVCPFSDNNCGRKAIQCVVIERL